MCLRGVTDDNLAWTAAHAFHLASRPPVMLPEGGEHLDPVAPEIPARYNLAPTDDIPVVRPDGPAMAHWGLVPGAEFPTFNARSETAHEKPTFARAFRERRCVVLFSGYYEWDAHKRPHYIRRADDQPVLLAGLYAVTPETRTGTACTILTGAPNATLGKLHTRMPCVLEPEAARAWLAPGDVDTHRRLLAPAPDGVLCFHQVSKRVGNARAEGPGLIEPIEPDFPGLFGN